MGFDYKYENNQTVFNILANFDLLFQLSAQNLDGFLKNILPSTPIKLPVSKKVEWKVIEPKPGDAPPQGVIALGAAAGTPGAKSGDIIKNMNAAIDKQATAGGLKFDYELPVHKEFLGVLSIDSIGARYKMNPGGVSGAALVNFTAKMGPIKLLVKGMGVEGEVSWTRPTKNLGLIDLKPKFVPPWNM